MYSMRKTVLYWTKCRVEVYKFCLTKMRSLCMITAAVYWIGKYATYFSYLSFYWGLFTPSVIHQWRKFGLHWCLWFMYYSYQAPIINSHCDGWLGFTIGPYNQMRLIHWKKSLRFCNDVGGVVDLTLVSMIMVSMGPDELSESEKWSEVELSESDSIFVHNRHKISFENT